MVRQAVLLPVPRAESSPSHRTNQSVANSELTPSPQSSTSISGPAPVWPKITFRSRAIKFGGMVRLNRGFVNPRFLPPNFSGTGPSQTRYPQWVLRFVKCRPLGPDRFAGEVLLNQDRWQ